MPNERARIRLNFTTRELEIEGPIPFVKELLDEYRPLVQATGESEDRPPLPVKAGPGPPFQIPPAVGKSIPDSFGEYLHAFPDSLSGPDKTLVAAVFVQAHSDDNSFSTLEVNTLLKNHGIRLSNASLAVKRMVAAKNSFSTARGKYRVSTEGHRAVDELVRGDSDG